mmetsp:Transcript_2089/g.7579  ORF Transcript_2089/g.7579 Transcript_2089/m.7579 type:complete len:516 (+) Transcript_2089:328-1875(+)|eukprot:CAMPEP_0114610418 /NCGR_PEP_ID=MMETSP0168-20121206/3591_1 /TAXON_ID=95228 ORGANISM="Vannella sp., Strain DIVA3 517/6/12" /NCGR_SAMPLE_ID=MMETSP0168 /ASSEMBLY_ACC=CAM_ASM_000044 /LENGTH=515 /DNA_ID=CAMNT_0001821361 /DNA_START=272 /DNA_END=1819 /DNA_ORIENTATION=+
MWELVAEGAAWLTTFESAPSTLIIQWGFIVILVMLSGMFSGLNLGLMSLDKVSLEIVIGSGTKQQSKFARRIYPIRKRGNLLLCTILLGNVAVNALLSILLADFTSGFVGFLLSTGIIVVCGEIVPQAVCSRHGLAVGYYTVWIVWIFLIVLLPISYPISKVLDCVLGRELGTIYSRQELKKLFDLHSTYSDITKEETTILAGALEFGSKRVEVVMTPLEKVYMISIDDVLSRELIQNMLNEGYSRVPVYEGSREKITGLLFVKDLALLNPDENLSVRKVLPTFGRNFPRVFADTPLSEMLTEFKNGQSHIAVVRRIDDTGDGDPTYENIGIITLEDVIEEILQDEIIDETDVYVDNTSLVAVGRAKVDYSSLNERDDGKPSELLESAFGILRDLPEFAEDAISDGVLRQLIQQSGVKSLSEHDANIFTLNKPDAFCCVVLGGAVELHDETGVTQQGESSTVGVSALTDDNWVPDFTAKPTRNTKIMLISRRAYNTAVQATQFERGSDDLVDDDF